MVGVTWQCQINVNNDKRWWHQHWLQQQQGRLGSQRPRPTTTCVGNRNQRDEGTTMKQGLETRLEPQVCSFFFSFRLYWIFFSVLLLTTAWETTNPTTTEAGARDMSWAPGFHFQLWQWQQHNGEAGAETHLEPLGPTFNSDNSDHTTIKQGLEMCCHRHAGQNVHTRSRDSCCTI